MKRLSVSIAALLVVSGLTAARVSTVRAQAQGQAPASQAPAGDPAAQPAVPVFGTESSVVLLDVVVRDKRGRLVRDLAASDFEVLEDGRKQEVSAFRVVDGTALLRAGAAGDASQAPGAGTEPKAGSGAPAAGGGGAPAAPATPPAPTAAQAFPRESGDASQPAVIAFVFDRLTTEARDIARKAAYVYADRGHVDGDIVGVFSLDLALRTIQPFTRDLNLIRTAFDRAAQQANTQYASTRDEGRALLDDARRTEQALSSLASGGSTDSSSQAQAAALSTRRLFDMMQARMMQNFDKLERDQQGFSSTNGLLAVVSGLKAIPGRKTIIFFSEGLSITHSVLAQFRSLVATANRANVAVYAVDAAGLRVASDTEEARKELVQTANMRMRQEGMGYIDGSDGSLMERAARSEDMLRINPKSGLGQLSDETGGFMVADTNDASKGFQRIQEEMRFYYLLSYAPSDAAFDGRFRTITVKATRPGVLVYARKGYFAVPPDLVLPVRQHEGPALAALERKPAPREFPLQIAAMSFPDAARLGRVPIMIEMPGEAIGFELDKKTKTYNADFAIVARLKDAAGREADRVSESYPLSVAADKVDAARKGAVLFYKEADVPPGRYTVEAVAYDSVSKKASVTRAAVEVPEAGAGALRLSSLLLLKRVEKLPPSEAGRDNPLHYGDLIVYPSLGEPFHKAVLPALAFFFDVYAAPGAAPRQVQLELVKGDKSLMKTAAALPAADANGRMQLAIQLPIQSKTLENGEYTLKASVASGQQTASRQVTFTVAE